MSTVSDFRIFEPPPQEPDPFRYGWRYVRIQRPDGTESFDQVPLTLEDVLFPETGDFIVQSDPHDNDLNYLKGLFKSRLAGDPHSAVVSDCRVDWNLPGVKPLGPDIAVFFDVKQYGGWSTLDVAAEGVRPALVVEVTSPDTRKNDLVDKFDYYHRAGVPLYVIVDARQDDGQERHLTLIGYRHMPAGYRAIAPDARGWLWLEPVGVWIGVARDQTGRYDRVACYDPKTGEELGDYTAVTRALALAMETRDQAEAARDQAEAARDQAEAARDQAEAARDQAEAARDQAELRATAEAEARTQAEAQIRELEAAMQRLAQGL